MKTCTTKSVFEAIVRAEGLNPDTAGLTATQMANRAELMNERLLEAWQSGFFTEILAVEQRRYRSTWNILLNYVTDDEVFYEDGNGNEGYYKSLVDSNVGQTPVYAADTAYWHRVLATDVFVRYIEFQQDGETEIESIDTQNGVFDRDPRIYRDAGRVHDVYLLDDKVLIEAENAPTQPWIRFRTVCPEFSMTAWSGSTAYTIGDLCYLASTGDTYKALQASTNQNPYTELAYWEPVHFPELFKKYVKHACAADLMMEDEGKYKQEGKAQAELERLQDVRIDQQGVRRRATFRR